MVQSCPDLEWCGFWIVWTRLDCSDLKNYVFKPVSAVVETFHVTWQTKVAWVRKKCSYNGENCAKGSIATKQSLLFRFWVNSVLGHINFRPPLYYPSQGSSTVGIQNPTLPKPETFKKLTFWRLVCEQTKPLSKNVRCSDPIKNLNLL